MVKKKKQKEVRACPNCGSIRVKGAYTMSPTERASYNIKNKMFVYSQENIEYYGCKSCGYYGPMPKVKQKDLADFKFRVKKSKDFRAQGINTNKLSLRLTSISTLVLIVSFYLYILTKSYFLLILGGLSILGIIYALIHFHIIKKKT